MGGLCSMLITQKKSHHPECNNRTKTHNVSKGTLIHLTAGVRRILSLDRWGMIPREVDVMKVGVGIAIWVSFDALKFPVPDRRSKMVPSRGPKNLVFDVFKLLSESDKLKENDEAEVEEGVAIEGVGRN